MIINLTDIILTWSGRMITYVGIINRLVVIRFMLVFITFPINYHNPLFQNLNSA